MSKTTKAQRDEWRRLDDQDRSVWSHDRGSVESQDPRALPGETSGFRYYMGSGAPLAVAARNALPALLDDLDAAEAEGRELRDVLLRNNFAPCDSMACNCNGWHERTTGSGFRARFEEIDEAVGEHNGKTLLDAVKQLIAERDEAVALIDAAKSDVRPESFLEHAQAILAKCIAPYSCEQMKAVGDALAGCYRKWELMSEVALKAKEDADALTKCKGCGGTIGDHLAPDQGGCPGSFEIDGVQMVPLAGRDHAVAERDALWKAHRDVVDERDDARAKLAALVKAADQVIDEFGLLRSATSIGVQSQLRAAIAAARGGANP